MLMTTGGQAVSTPGWETSIALRNMALLQHSLPKYLLAPEVAVLLSFFEDERQRMVFAFIWNTGARITEALLVTPEDLELDGLRTLKQRSRGRPAKDEKIARVLPLMDDSFVRDLRRFLATFRPARRSALFPITRKTAWSWLTQALNRAEAAGISFAVNPVSPKTLRHSFAMHLFFNYVPKKVVQTYLGHERPESTEVYLKVFALDVAPQLGIRFSLDAQDYAGMLTRK